MSEKRKQQKPLMIYMPDILFDELKKHCHEQDITLTKYVIRSLVMRMNMEKSREDQIRY